MRNDGIDNAQAAVRNMVEDGGDDNRNRIECPRELYSLHSVLFYFLSSVFTVAPRPHTPLSSLQIRALVDKIAENEMGK